MFWFIDSIDVRGGFAFASQRECNLMTTSRLHAGPSVFIAAPSFQPEPVINPALAAGAARRAAQEGLFLTEGEVPFQTAEVAAEFVRRAYLAAASNGGGEGQAPPPEPDPGTPPDGLTYAVEAVRKCVEEFSHQVHENQRVGQSTRSDWFDEHQCRPGDVSALATYGLQLALHLLDPVPDGIGDWRDRSYLWHGEPVPQGLVVALRSDRCIRKLFGSTAVPRLSWGDLLFDPHLHPLVSTDWGDPVDTLTRVPLPKSITKQLQLQPTSANLYNLLLRVLASPLIILEGSDQQAKQIASLTVFATAVIVSAQEPASSSVKASTAIISQWLRRQLPSVAFHQFVENLITERR